MNAIVELKQGALAQTANSGRMAVAEIIQHVAMVQEVMRAVMKKDVHFGIIPGTDKPTLYKPGAEVLCMAFRIASAYEIEDLSTADTVRYRVTCTGTHQTTGTVLGSGMGEASSGEEKYKWRKAYEPEFNETPANLRRKKTGYNKAKRENYAVFQVRTEQADLANTVLKMANKRAHMAMILSVTAASDCFAQDLEDMDEALRDHLSRHTDDAPVAATASWSDDLFTQRLPEWHKAIKDKKATADAIIAKARTKHPLTPEQEQAIRTPPKSDATDAAPKFTFAQVADRISKATDADGVAIARDLIASIADGEQRNELHALATARETEFKE